MDELSQPGLQGNLSAVSSLGLAGARRKAAVFAWGLVTLLALLSFALSLYSFYMWDSVPASQAKRYYPDMNAQDVQSHADYQNAVLQAGFSLSGYAVIFSTVRMIGALALFLVGFQLLRRYSNHLMAVLMAVLLSVLAAAGILDSPLFGAAVSIAPWMYYPVALLSWLLWCGVIVLYTFPDGRFTPRWTRWLAILVVPLTFLLAFNVNIFLNPGTWPEPLSLLPNLLFIGGGFFAILYRYWRTRDLERERRMRGDVLGLSLLLAAYFVDFFMNDLYYALSGHYLIEGNHAVLVYTLVHEPIWYALQVFFAIGLAISVFRHKLLEN